MVVHPAEPKQEVVVHGGQGDRLQVIVQIILIMLTVFSRLYIKRWCTQESRSRRWEYLEGKETLYALSLSTFSGFTSRGIAHKRAGAVGGST